MKPKYSHSHRSGLETAFQTLVTSKGYEVEYETDSIPFVTAPQKRRYIPDWKLRDKVYVETKGRFTAADRKKMLYVTEQHPDIKIYMLFQRNNTISKTSRTTYGDWCDKHGIEWAVFQDTDTWFKWFTKKGKKK